LAEELGPARLLVVEYHTKDRWASTETEALYDYYKADGTPTIYFNGGNGVSGGGDTNYLYARYKRIVDKELAKQAQISLTGAKLSDSVTGPVSVKLTNTSSQTMNSAELFGIAYQDLGTERHRFLVSDVTTVSVARVSPGETLELELNFETQAPALNIVVFLKSSSGQILQATTLIGSSRIWLP
jgi:hypothetical protein